MNEYETEPVPGLPELPPAGERILWQGAPRWSALAVRAFHVRKVAVYFGLLLLGVAVTDLMAGQPLSRALLGGGWLLVLAHVAIGLMLLLARVMSRATVYTITNRRVVMRFGVAISLTINIPFRLITSAALKEYADGTGDIPLSLADRRKVSYVVMWPHVRPWHFADVQPMLRAIPEAARVAAILSAAVAEAAAPVPAGTRASGRVDSGREAELLAGTPAVQSV